MRGLSAPRARRRVRLPVNILSMIVALTLAVGEGRSEMQAAAAPRITERLWQDPGPVQSGPGAPKVLLIYPRPGTTLSYGQELTRYAGRVEPANARVLLDGTPIRVWRGGVFTGLLSIPVGERTVTFSARREGKSTTVKRTVSRRPQRKGPSSRPMKFHPRSAIVPAGGEYWLRPGSKLPVKLYASPGHEASVRVGADGPWFSMRSVKATVEQGGAYAGSITVDDSVDTESAEALEFRLVARGNGGGNGNTITMKSSINVRRLPETAELVGEVTYDFGTFLKNEEGWLRWGNWNSGTPFRIIEKRGERVKVDFGAGETGFVETAAVKLSLEPSERAGIDLPEPKVDFGESSPADRVSLEWNVPHPIASVFHTDADEGDGDENTRAGGMLRISLPGAASAERFRVSGPDGGYFGSIRVEPGGDRSPPEIRLAYQGRELWGYGYEMIGEETLRLTVRLRPDPPERSRTHPLGGLRIMVDAGHGGDDIGAIGPSGLAEADVNLAVAAFLGIRLEALGAEVRQIRTGDGTVGLDDRVREAVDWKADLFISVHHNSVAMGTHPTTDSGPIVFYHYAHSVSLAAAVAEELTTLLMPGRKPRILSQNFRVNRNVSICPSILVEGGFVCHPEDEIKLRDTRTLEAMGDAIARGVVNLMSGEAGR